MLPSNLRWPLMWDLSSSQGIPKHFTVLLGERTFQHCQTCLNVYCLWCKTPEQRKHLFDSGEFDWRTLVIARTRCRLTHVWFASWRSPSVYPALSPRFFFFLVLFHVLFSGGWLADRGCGVTRPSWPRCTMWSSPLGVSLSIWQGYLGGLVSEALHNDSKVNSSCGSRVK